VLESFNHFQQSLNAPKTLDQLFGFDQFVQGDCGIASCSRPFA
jgi:hypothetical protein